MSPMSARQGPSPSTKSSTEFFSGCGVMNRPRMWFSGTLSHQTVCQMPLMGLYQMPPGLRFCLPRVLYPLSVSSVTRTTRLFSPPSS